MLMTLLPICCGIMILLVESPALAESSRRAPITYQGPINSTLFVCVVDAAAAAAPPVFAVAVAVAVVFLYF